MGFKVIKRKKNRRYRGSKGCGGGFRQKRRGKGNKGGVGMSGTGKRSSQKMQHGQIVAKEHGFEKYFGKSGYTSASTAKDKKDEMNLDDIQKVYGDKKEIVLEGYKILGRGEGFKVTIKAETASKSAIEKMEKAGGKIIIKEVPIREVKKVEKKVEAKEKKK